MYRTKIDIATVIHFHGTSRFVVFTEVGTRSEIGPIVGGVIHPTQTRTPHNVHQTHQKTKLIPWEYGCATGGRERLDVPGQIRDRELETSSWANRYHVTVASVHVYSASRWSVRGGGKYHRLHLNSVSRGRRGSRISYRDPTPPGNCRQVARAAVRCE